MGHKMTRPMRLAAAALVSFAVLAPVLANAQSEDERYNIMRAEPGSRPETPTPWLPPTYKSPRGSKQQNTATAIPFDYSLRGEVSKLRSL